MRFIQFLTLTGFDHGLYCLIPHRMSQSAYDRLDLLHEGIVPHGSNDRMEFVVLVEYSVHIVGSELDLSPHPFKLDPELFDLFLFRVLHGELHNARFHDLAQFHQILIASRFIQYDPVNDRIDHCLGETLADISSFCTPYFQHAKIYQYLNRFPHGISANPKTLRKFHFRWDLITRTQFFADHRLYKAVYDLLYDRLAFDSLQLNHKFYPIPIFCKMTI